MLQTDSQAFWVIFLFRDGGVFIHINNENKSTVFFTLSIESPGQQQCVCFKVSACVFMPVHIYTTVCIKGTCVFLSNSCYWFTFLSSLFENPRHTDVWNAVLLTRSFERIKYVINLVEVGEWKAKLRFFTLRLWQLLQLLVVTEMAVLLKGPLLAGIDSEAQIKNPLHLIWHDYDHKVPELRIVTFLYMYEWDCSF